MKPYLKQSLVALWSISMLSACSLSDIVNVDKAQIGADTDHDYLKTRSGALSVYYSVAGTFKNAVSKTSLQVGVFTDELTSRPEIGSDYSYSAGNPSADMRVERQLTYNLMGIPFQAYNELQATRVRATHARHFLNMQEDHVADYAISASYAFEAYSIMLLAENLCSGVPLSDVPYGGPVTYGKGVPTDSLYKIAVAKFDSALAIEHDSMRFKTLAMIGKGRALLSLGDYKKAAEAVQEVKQSDVFDLRYTEAPTPGAVVATPQNAFWTMTGTGGAIRNVQLGHEITNAEGLNGLQWFMNPLSPDPRLPLTVANPQVMPIVRQAKFPNGNITLKIAGWIEAKMIEAEYLLSIDDPNWIEPINLARRTVNLPDTVSSDTAAVNVNLLFRERAFWQYGHGTRLADMRRLVRQYGREVNKVFPVGTYTRSNSVYSYGDAVVFVPDIEEFDKNFNYSGCINRNP